MAEQQQCGGGGGGGGGELGGDDYYQRGFTHRWEKGKLSAGDVHQRPM